MAKLKIGDVVRLLKAGYTKEEINELRDLESDPEPPADPEPAADPEPSFVDEIAALTAQVKDLTESVQAFKRGAAEKGTPEPDKTADDIIKDMISKGVS
jgi:hypothetical protein